MATDFTILTDKPAWVKTDVDADWQKYDPASDFDGELTYQSLVGNTFVALASATRGGRDGILLLIAVTEEQVYRPSVIFIHWDWRDYPSTANLVEAGLPGTDFDDWVKWLNDYGYRPTSGLVRQIVSRLQDLINDRRDEANLPVDDADRDRAET